MIKNSIRCIWDNIFEPCLDWLMDALLLICGHYYTRLAFENIATRFSDPTIHWTVIGRDSRFLRSNQGRTLMTLKLI